MFNEYLKQIVDKYKTGDSLEHTHRIAFENLLNQFLSEVIKNDLKIIHEPKREKFGAPDFKIIDKASNIIGYIECKDIGEDIESLVDSPQIKKYLEITANLILTNYLDFILFKNGSVVKHTSIASKLDLKQAKPKAKNENEINDLLKAFFLSSTEQISSTKKLSYELAKRTKILRDLILDELSESMTNPDYKDHDPQGHKMKNPFNKFYLIFEKVLVNGLTLEDFADMYAEIIGFGLLFFKLSKDILLTKENILSNIPNYIPLLRDFFPNAKFDEWNSTIVWVLDEILLLLNNIDSKIIRESLSYKTLSILKKRDANLNDPFLYFYEEFLEVYDKNTKVKRGVFYTPESVVSFIIRSLDVIIKEKLGIKKGFLDNSIKILDFATGTGTFILALIEYIKDELQRTNNYGLFNTEVNEFILRNIYGFELLVVPYIICHLRIHEYLESFDFHYSDQNKERAEIYLTNTLDNTKYELTGFFDEIDEESELANKVKNEEQILVIMGNPPYSVSSSNKTGFVAEELMSTYKTAVREERNIQPLSDDYIKFIRFAHWKMEKINKGVIGIITNNSFIDGIIHRGMREELTKTFDEIYILNLHGNSNIGESCSDGSKDENVFDIKQGVSISFFVKTGKRKNENIGVYYYSLQGLREKKYDFLYDKNISKIKWDKLKNDAPNFWFKMKDLEGETEYNKFLKVNDIFNNNSVGVVTGDDENKIFLKDKTKTDLYYRPLDFRFIDFNDKSLQRPRLPFMFQYKNNNVGLLVCKQFKNEFNHSLITNCANSKHIIGDAAYNFPLYLYPDSNSLDKERYPNFTDEFNTIIKQKELSDKSPEAILGYIYSVLYSPTYRKKYYEFLKIDFPRIPFSDDIKLFDKLSDIGQRLIDLHLLETDFEKSIVSFPVQNADFKVTKVEYKNGKVYFNDATYFDNVPENVWNYYIGGYQVLDKWLKERKKQCKVGFETRPYELTGDDVRHFIKVCDVLAETIKLQEEIDKLTKEWI